MITPVPVVPPPSQPAPPRERDRWKLIGAELVAWVKTFASAGVYATLIVTFGFQVARVEGRSMEPTLHDRDRLVVNKLAFRVHAPEVGDVVMLLHPNDPDQTLVKRVVAGPGDTVGFQAGIVIRNGVAVDEDYVPEDVRSAETLPPLVVPQGFYYVLGDHRNNSMDSRLFGPVPQKYILGRVQVRWWPVTNARTFAP
jgi:signal peptidase I